MRKPRTLNYCRKEQKAILHTELDAKMVLAKRIAKDKGEVRYYQCAEGHYHLTSQALREQAVA